MAMDKWSGEAHYLSGMAKVLVEDIAHGMMTGPVR